MVRFVCSLFLAAMMAATGSLSASVIQQVSYGCGEECNGSGCKDGCKSRNTRRSRRSGKNECDPFDNGRQRCGVRSTWHDFGMNWTGRCGPIGRAARWRVPGAKCLKYCMDTKGSGDSGWSPPARMPVNRTGTGFGSYTSYGGPGYGGSGAGMVYQPTDTAQLGYRYAHAPTWRSNPGMIPRTPIPSNFHARFCPRDPRGGQCINPGAMMMDSGMMMNGGMIIDGEVMGGEYCPACTSTPVSRPAAPVTRSPTEAVVHMNQARRPNTTVAVGTPPVRIPAAAPTGKNNIRLTAQATPVRQQPQIQLPPQQWSQPQVKRPQPQPRRQAAKRRPTQKKSGGWFGLPSLGDVKF